MGHEPFRPLPRGWSHLWLHCCCCCRRRRVPPAPAHSTALTSLPIYLSTEDFEGENPQVPKLEKSISGTSPKREHLPLAVGIAFFLMTLLAS